MDQDEESPDMFTISVGNLPPKSCVLIKITYVAELSVDGDEILFRIPSAVAPWKKDVAIKDKTQDKTETVEAEGEKKVKPSVQVSIEMPFLIKRVTSPSHKILHKSTETKSTVELMKNQDLKDGFELRIQLAEIHVPRMWIEEDPETKNEAYMLTFYPEFETGQFDNDELNSETIIILDFSHSMKGKSEKSTKILALLTLHHLPKNAKFNIIVFGTVFKELFACSKPKNDRNLSAARKFIAQSTAAMGGTELVRPLTAYLHLPPSDGLFRNFLLISDGFFSGQESVYKASIASVKQSTRLFCCGVGSSPNRHSLTTLSKLGGGSYQQFDDSAKSKWSNKMKDQLSKMKQLALNDVRVLWQNEHDLFQAPEKLSAVFNGQRIVVYGMMNSEENYHESCRMVKFFLMSLPFLKNS